MQKRANYLDELDEFSRRYIRSSGESNFVNPDNQEEDEGVLDLGGEYEYDTRNYREEFDLDRNGVVIDHSDPLEANAAAQKELRELVPFGGTYQDDFQKFLNDLNIQYFTAIEIMRAKGGSHFNPSSMCYNKNSLAPRSKWPLFARTIVALDTLRQNLEYSLFLVVAYRSKPYNECLIEQSKKNNGGKSGVAKYSQHLNFNAIDFRGKLETPGDWGDAVIRYKENEDTKVWCKVYSSFVHIDTRGNDM